MTKRWRRTNTRQISMWVWYNGIMTGSNPVDVGPIPTTHALPL